METAGAIEPLLNEIILKSMFFLYIIILLSHLNPLTISLPLFPFPVTPCSLLPSTQGSSSSGRTRSFSLLPHLTPSSSPASQRHLSHTASPSNIVTITHHKSPAAARRAKSQYPGRLLEVKEVGVTLPWRCELEAAVCFAFLLKVALNWV